MDSLLAQNLWSERYSVVLTCLRNPVRSSHPISLNGTVALGCSLSCREAAAEDRTAYRVNRDGARRFGAGTTPRAAKLNI